jgi:hypothetical protein
LRTLQQRLGKDAATENESLLLVSYDTIEIRSEIRLGSRGNSKEVKQDSDETLVPVLLISNQGQNGCRFSFGTQIKLLKFEYKLLKV